MGVEVLVKIDEAKVAILLATYNGEKYVEEQIESLMTQKGIETKLYIHDDLSTDNTMSIVEKMSSKYPNRITLINSTQNLGVVKSYQFLLDNVEADFYFFSDQDDVWCEDKVIQEINILAMSEKRPALVYSDLQIVDANLNVISNSMFNHMNVKNTDKLCMLLVQNVITGNTVGFNLSLRNLLVNVFRMDNESVLMHDGWIGLIASIYGDLSFLNKPTIYYRQHTNNVVGAKKGKLRKIFQINRLRRSIINTILQAKELDKKLSLIPDTDENFCGIIHSYAAILQNSSIIRIKILLKNHIRKQGMLRNLFFFVLLFTEAKERNN